MTSNFRQLGPERFRAPEILFNPEIIGQEDPGVHQVVIDSINRVDLDLRKSLFSNIVLSGGTSLCKGSLSMLIIHLAEVFDTLYRFRRPSPERG